MIIEVSISKEGKRSIINLDGGQKPSYLVYNIDEIPKIGARVVRILKATDGSRRWKGWGENGSGIIYLKTRFIETVTTEEWKKRVIG